MVSAQIAELNTYKAGTQIAELNTDMVTIDSRTKHVYG